LPAGVGGYDGHHEREPTDLPAPAETGAGDSPKRHGDELAEAVERDAPAPDDRSDADGERAPGPR